MELLLHEKILSDLGFFSLESQLTDKNKGWQNKLCGKDEESMFIHYFSHQKKEELETITRQQTLTKLTGIFLSFQPQHLWRQWKTLLQVLQGKECKHIQKVIRQILGE